MYHYRRTGNYILVYLCRKSLFRTHFSIILGITEVLVATGSSEVLNVSGLVPGLRRNKLFALEATINISGSGFVSLSLIVIFETGCIHFSTRDFNICKVSGTDYHFSLKTAFIYLCCHYRHHSGFECLPYLNCI